MEVPLHGLKFVQAETVRRRADQGVAVAALDMRLYTSSRMERHANRCRSWIRRIPARFSEPPCNCTVCPRKQIEGCASTIGESDFVIPVTGHRFPKRLRRLLQDVSSDLSQNGIASTEFGARSRVTRNKFVGFPQHNRVRFDGARRAAQPASTERRLP